MYYVCIYFWITCSILALLIAYEGAAFQVIRYLQQLYGFVVLDYNYTTMMTYRELARSAVILAMSSVRSIIPIAVSFL